MHRQSEARAGTIEGTDEQETPADQCRLTTLHEGQGSNPPIRAPYMQLARIPHTHQTTPRATRAPGADKPARHPPRAQQVPAQRTHNERRCAKATPRRPKARLMKLRPGQLILLCMTRCACGLLPMTCCWHFICLCAPWGIPASLQSTGGFLL